MRRPESGRQSAVRHESRIAHERRAARFAEQSGFVLSEARTRVARFDGHSLPVCERRAG